jgi:hypothetical protein
MHKKQRKAPRPKMPRVSDEMKRWSAMLGDEIRAWPQVKSRPMFGFLCFYRRNKIFGALPVTRGVNSPNSFMFKIKPMPPDLLSRASEDHRIDTENRIPSAKWYSFEVSSAEDLRDALWWLDQAYQRAK